MGKKAKKPVTKKAIPKRVTRSKKAIRKPRRTPAAEGLQTYALIPTRGLVAVPGIVLPIAIQKGQNTDAVSFALAGGKSVILSLQRGEGESVPSAQNLCRVGALAKVVHTLRLSNGDMRVKLAVEARVKIDEFVSFTPFIRVRARKLEPSASLSLTSKDEKFIAQIKEHFSVLGSYDPTLSENLSVVQESADPGVVADVIASSLPLEDDDLQQILEETHSLKRLRLIAPWLSANIDSIVIRERVSLRAQSELGRAQHEELLREQLRQIRSELGEEEDDEQELSDLKAQLDKLRIPDEAKAEAEKQIRRLRQLHPDTSEAALARTYLDWILDLPWGKRTKDHADLSRAKKILDEDHYGLKQTKERILDFLGVRKLKKDLRGPILLLSGPPGVGKTSLGRSIARALGRKFVRISVGGLRDEAELRGHRRTYVGALPGRIIQSLKTAGVKNPVFMLDELDKVGSDFRGDPASVLLEVLDPEQNKNFEDHYLNIPFDLSEVMFIGTANVTFDLPTPLLDRMEVIDISGYTTEEKLEIARRYIVPREKIENGLQKYAVRFTEPALLHVIESYTKESGVRELTRVISTVLRKCARMAAEGQSVPRALTPKVIENVLGPVKYLPEKLRVRDEIGVVTGLAWTPVGGEILTIEVSVTSGKGSLSVTGQIGDVMKESAMAALTFVLSNAEKFSIDKNFYETAHVHVHVPQGGIPKDGPSAGLAIVTGLVSLLSKRPISRGVAMTGEITLRGSVIEIGGLREKALAALRAGIHTVIIPKENERELSEFPKYLRDQVKFIPVSSVDEMLNVALLPGRHERGMKRRARTRARGRVGRAIRK